MGIFDKIKNAIWGHDEVASRPIAVEDPIHDAYLGTDQATTGVVPEVSTPAHDPAVRDIAAAGVQPMSKPVEIERAQNPAGTMTEIDVAAQLDKAASSRGHQLNWRTSIVDLMKALGMDASLEERRELAQELGYKGDTHDTAAMNTFLHRALMLKLAENGGVIPAELRN